VFGSYRFLKVLGERPDFANAPLIISETFRDSEELEGVFSGRMPGPRDHKSGSEIVLTFGL
jgi:hypothetical protein